MRISRTNQRGGARLKFLIVVAIIGTLVFVGYKFVPVLYQARLYKDLMQHDVDVAAALGYKPQWVSDQLTKSAPEYGIPASVLITPQLNDNRMEVTVQYTLPIEFPGYTYEYQFDHTARSTAFLTFK